MLMSLTGCNSLLEGLQSQLGDLAGEEAGDINDILSGIFGDDDIGNILDDVLGGDGNIGDILDNVLGGESSGSDNPGPSAASSVTRGEVNGDTYTSDSCGLSFTVKGNWRILSEAELAANVNAGMELLDPDDFQRALATQAAVYDVMAMDSVTRSSLLIGYENLSLTGSVGISPSDYMNSAIRIMNQSGMSVELTGHKNITVCGVRFDRFECSVRYSGTSMFQYYYVRHFGNYMNIMVIGVNGQDNISQIEAMFN